MNIRSLVVWCLLWSVVAQTPDLGSAPTPPTVTKKNSTSESSVVPDRISRTFPASGISRVILRAYEANAAKERETETDPPSVTISAESEGGAKGYHPSDPNWRETPAAKWGLDFVAKRFGSALVISTKNEIRYIHHYYGLKQIYVRLPMGVQLVREPRVLTGDGSPNLRSPSPQ